MKLNEIEENQRNDLSVIELSKQGRQKLRSRKYGEAYSFFLQGLEREPENPYLLSGLGDSSREMGKFDVAESCYQKLLEIDGNNLFALRGLGDVHKKLNQHPAAISVWERYLQLRPQDKHVMSRIADSAKILLQFERAETMYYKILEFAPEDRFALSGLADLQHRLGKDHEAIKIYEKILDLDGNSLHILTILGKLCWRISDFELSEIYFRRALNIDPQNPYALYGLGNCHRWHRRYQEAVDVWQKILLQSEGTQSLHTRMGDAYCHLGQQKAAENSYKRSLSYGRDSFAMAGLICLCVETGDLDMASGMFYDMVVSDADPLYQLDLLSKRFIRSDQRARMMVFYRQLLQGAGEREPLGTELSAALETMC